MSEESEARSRGRRGGRRGKQQTGRSSSAVEQRPWQQPRVPFPPMQLLSDDEIEAIHDASLTVLEEIGMDFLLPEARELLKAAGADVDPNSERVRFDRAMIEETIRTAPSEFTLHARNPERNLRMGGSWMAFGCVSSPPNASDMDNGRRAGNTQDFQNLLRLSQYFNVVTSSAAIRSSLWTGTPRSATWNASATWCISPTR